MNGYRSIGSSAEKVVTSPARSSRITAKKLLLKPEMGALAGAVAVWIFFAVVAGDQIFNARGTASYLEVAAELGILAVFVALLMIGGEFDLSLGSTIGASGMIVALMASKYGYNLWFGIGVALVFAIVVGVTNGVLVLKTGLPSFIVTLVRFHDSWSDDRHDAQTHWQNPGRWAKDLPGYESASKLFGYEYSMSGAKFSGTIIWWLVLTVFATSVRSRFETGLLEPAATRGVASLRCPDLPREGFYSPSARQFRHGSWRSSSHRRGQC